MVSNFFQTRGRGCKLLGVPTRVVPTSGVSSKKREGFQIKVEGFQLEGLN